MKGSEFLKPKVNALDISADDQLIAVGTNNSLAIHKQSAAVGGSTGHGSYKYHRSFTLGPSHYDAVGKRTVNNVKPIVDLKFNPFLTLSHLIATSSSSGVVAIWDLNVSLREQQLQLQSAQTEHTQTVTSIAWKPTDPEMYVSGSQDRSIKLWDLRVGESSETLYPRSGVVRDVRYRPGDSQYTASAFDNGTVQIWDMRWNKQCTISFTAHDMALTVDWHPSSPHLVASGGRDGFIKVWNIQNTSELDTPLYTIQTIGASVSKVKWRPNHYHQIASSSSRGSAVSVWDVEKPDVPLCLVSNKIQYNTAQYDRDVLVGFVWKDQHVKEPHVEKSELRGQWWHPSNRRYNTIVENKEFNSSNVYKALGDTEGSAHRSLNHRLEQRQYETSEELESSWGRIVLCSKTSVHEVTLEDAVKPLEGARPSCLTLSPMGHMAVVHGDLSRQYTSNALSRTEEGQAKEVAVEPQQSIGVFKDTEHDSIIFNAKRFRELALAYHTPQTIRMERDKGFHQNKTSATGIGQGDEEQIVHRSCDHNAKVAEEASAPALATLWRLIKQYYTKYYAKQPQLDLAPLKPLMAAKSHPTRKPSFRRPANEPASQRNNEKQLAKNKEERLEMIVDANIPIEKTGSLWEPSSLQLLAKLDEILPISRDELSLNSTAMRPDNNELTSALKREQQSDKRRVLDRKKRPEFLKYNNPLHSGSRTLRLAAFGKLQEGNSTVKAVPMRRSQSEGNFGASEPVRKEDTEGVSSHLSALYPEMIQDILQHHADKGDAQTCVMVTLVLKSHLQIDNKRIEQWLCSYIDLLQRLQLFTVAARIISTCDNEFVQARYQRSNTVSIVCRTKGCTNQIVPNKRFKGLCPSCMNSISRCSICQLPVRQVYVWCQVCGHGGHLGHLKHWFETQEFCPAGCGHKCHALQRSLQRKLNK